MQEFLYDAKNFCSTYEFELTLVDSTARETVRSNFSYTRAVTSCKRLAVSNVHHYNRILQCPALVKFFCCYFRSYRVSGGTYCVSSEHSVKLFWKMSNYFGIYCVLIVLCYRDMHAESRNWFMAAQVAWLYNWTSVWQFISYNEVNLKHCLSVWKCDKCALVMNIKYSEWFYAVCGFRRKWGRIVCAACKIWSFSDNRRFRMALPSQWKGYFLLELLFALIQGSSAHCCVLWCRPNTITVSLRNACKRMAEFKASAIMEPPENVASKSPLFGAVGLEGVACPNVVEAPKYDGRCKCVGIFQVWLEMMERNHQNRASQVYIWGRKRKYAFFF